MKISILQQDLLPALQAVSRSAGIRSTLPVLANVLIQTENGRLKLSATNLELGVIKRVNAEVVEEGALSVPAKTFLEAIASLSPVKLELESVQDQLKITTPHFKASINGIPASEFPAIPLSSDTGVLIKAEILKKSIPEISFAAAADEGRPVLTGILTEIKNKQLELVATDGFRLAHKQMKFESSGDFKAVIPRRTFEEIVRLIDEDLKLTKEGKEDKEQIQIATSDNQNQLIFKIGQTELSSRLIEGQFPAWEKIFPKTFQNRAVVDRQELLKAVKMSSVFAKDAANITKIKSGENKLSLSSETKEVGGQQTEIDAQTEGESIEVAFNSRFLIDALSACSSAQVSMEFSGNLSPALIKPLGEEGLEYIIMPVRLS